MEEFAYMKILWAVCMVERLYQPPSKNVLCSDPMRPVRELGLWLKLINDNLLYSENEKPLNTSLVFFQVYVGVDTIADVSYADD